MADAPEQEARADKNQSSSKRSSVRAVFSYAAIFVGVLLLVWALKAFCYQVYVIPSGSMEDTIQIDDYVFANKLTFTHRDPQAGDIVTFQDITGEDRVLIKRVIAVGGQTVDLKDGKVVVDGQVLDEPYTTGASYPLNSTISYPYTVPEDSLWVMGDNREHSSDSRMFGAIPVSSVLEHADFIYWPLDHFGSLYK